ncbi:MAG TPA: glycosyltransferase family 2 protein [Smithella sp.]|nr:MAG: Undecaprenyl-phosphate 4-deoxy-4-formamido-L-arabinose transferase [Deltaproteobacteria bacterium ADurb.Bin022]HNY50365.1 glycosyltransferase family 2 protein [Smithella sp.]HOG88962.1 glycosyltransferase family 2 protein [Smithella sp.]HQG66809.1 glycosyltransferase family 2 protein [Smithella sp.]HQH17788.1 glycosyltransferase family 2 protein [Smithella sp.]
MTKVSQGISVIIPVYNSEDSLRLLIQRIEPVLKSLTAQYEVIFVNDGSKDHSWQRIKDLSGLHSWITGIELMRNYGQHNALLCGIRAARYEILVTMDDDLQHPPEEIPKLITKLLEGYDVVYGTPEKEQHGFWRDRASQISKLILQESMGAEIARKAGAFRAFKRDIRAAFENYQSPYVSIDVLLTWGTARFAAIPVRHDARQIGVSNYSLGKLVNHALNMMTGFSTVPLQLASLLGFAITFFGLCVLVYVLGRYFIQGASVPGFAFLASIISIFAGAQMFSLGIMGEYLARMHSRSMGRPPSVIRDVVGFLHRND